MTINKSQGQTLKNVGVWLNDSCFAHGQLYVAMSRVGSPSDIKFAIRQMDNFTGNFTSNIVYKEVLVKGKQFSISIIVYSKYIHFSLMSSKTEGITSFYWLLDD